MYQVLARKYRPQTFAELIGQEHVRTTLENAISQNRTAHGYIFSGQRGTGKTSVARILARCLNCVQGPSAAPCGVCSSCTEISAGNSVDVIEIDAASNRGINEMRELRESIRYRPARDRYKIFIIDEAHQITNEAFNALLKTLEEPPEWVVFLLCTTEAHKIPTTIASRCQQFAFRSVDFDDVVARLEWICRQEGIDADAETLAVLAQAGEGSVRDSLSALDQAIACCGGRLDAAEVRRLLGAFSLEALHQVTEALGRADARRMLELVQQLERDGRNLQHFCRELARYFRNLLVARIAGAGSRLIAASGREQQRLAEIAASFSEEDLTRYLQLTLDLFRDLQFSLQPRLHLEIGLLKLVHAGRLLPIEEALAMAGQASPGPPASPATAPRSRQAASAPPLPQPSGWREKLHAALTGSGQNFIADAVEHSSITETENELQFAAAREFALALQSKDLQKIVQDLAGRPLRVSVKIGDVASPPAAAADSKDNDEDEVAQRAFSHPEVQRFRQMFQGSQVRTVRNLKE
jgi:DNA polymerase-3 subunit gamma/tau